MADVGATLVSWSNTTASNSPAGTTTIGTGLDDNLREIQGVIVRGLSFKGADIASAASTDLGAIEGLMHDITGTVTITGLGTVRAGIWKIVKFEGALTLTHNATSLILPGAQNITTVNGDVGIFMSEGSGNWRCLSYLPTSNATPNALTSGRVPYATTGGRLTDAANLTFDGTTLTANTLTVSTGALTVSGAGPHAIGASTQTTVQVTQGGAFTGSSTVIGYALSSTLTPTGGNDAYGLSVTPTFVETGSGGPHALFAGIRVAPTITAGANNVSDVVGIDVATFAAQATTTQASAMRLALPTGATSNAIFALPTDNTDPTGGGGAATGRIPVLIGGAIKYLAYY